MDDASPRLSSALPVPGLDRIIRRCMRAAPAERYASAATLLADLQSVGSGTLAEPVTSEAGRLWWWKCHQVTIAVLNALMVVALWQIRHWTPRPYGSMIFLVALMLATISVTLRLNLWFTSRVHPETLAGHRARLFPAVTAADSLLAVAWLVTAALLAGEHDEMAALLVTVGVATFASLLLIEPATTRAAGIQTRVPRPPGI
jgi:hypothetical protein